MDISAKRIIIWIITALLLTGCSKARTDGRQFTKSSFCPIHNVQMKEVPIIYGYPGDVVIEKAERGEVILGGCIIKDDNPKTGYICPIDGEIFYQKQDAE